MNPSIRYLASTLAVGLLASQAQAQVQKMRPGLWEHGFTILNQGGQMAAAMAQMQQSMASLPPEQRKMMEQMMAQQGVSMGPKGNSVKVCVSKEEADLDRIPPQEGCTQKVERVNANTIKASFSCKGAAGEPPSTGDGTITFSSPTAYTGQFTVRTTVDKKPEQLSMSQTGKWLAADCGQFKSR